MPSTSSAVPDSALWRDADFRRLWVGQSASQLGEHASLVVLPLIAVLTLHLDVGGLGALRAVGQAPLLLLSLFIGAWVDRWRARNVMMLADLGRASVLAGVAAAALAGGLDLPVLLVAGFALGTMSVFFDVAYQALLVRMLRRDQLLRGNSALEGSRSAAQVGGPALGGALVSLPSASIAAVANGLLFVLSFGSVSRIRHREPAPKRAGRAPHVWREVREGVRFVAGEASLRAVCLASGAFQFSFAAVMTAYLVYLTEDLRLPGGAVGLVLAATGPGALAGALLAARLPGRFGHGVVLVSAATIGNGVLLLVPAVQGAPAVTVPALVAINLVVGAFGQLVNVTVMAIRQALTPDRMQGRAAATITFAGMGLTPLGSLLGGFLAGELGLRTAIVVAGAGMMLSPLVMVLSPLVRLGRELPVPEDR
ncbi:MFS transporter [Dactylosporangium sp. NPDC049742]|uniref:MFS transporter n=1 Tax=Dactylosporangium sp. NPDC049742 TaxID=3154737 RepID=UPI003412A7C6